MSARPFVTPEPSTINTYLFGSQRYRVAAELVVVLRLNGRRQQFNRGDLLPKDIHPRHAADMLGKRLIEKVAA